MVVGEPALVAVGAPGADRAVIDRLGIAVGNPGVEIGEQPPAQAAVVGGELGYPEAVLLAVPRMTWISSGSAPWARASSSL